MIDWSTLKRDQFEQLVELLIRRLYAGAADEVIAVDGRGGDSGIDVLVRQGERVRIFQLKHFTDGFPKSNGSRRTQIRKSFAKAMSHKPSEWTLVYPGKLTPGEREFIETLPVEIEVARRIMDSTAMDDYLAAHPDIETSFYLNSESFMARSMADYISEASPLREILDLAERQKRLHTIGDSVDPYWRVKPTDFRGRPALLIEPKTDRSHQDSPISIKVSSTSKSPSSMTTMIERVLGFGTNEELTLNSSDGWMIDLDGPAFLQSLGLRQGSLLTVFQADHSPPNGATVTFRMLSDDDRSFASYEGQVSHFGSGAEGQSFEASLYQALKLQVLVSSTPAGQLNLSFELGGAAPEDVINALDFCSDMQAAARVEVFFNEHRFGFFQPGNELDAPWPEAPAWRALADDLQVVQSFVRTRFGIPVALTEVQRVQIRFARMLIDGLCASVPDGRALNINLLESAATDFPDLLQGSAQAALFDGEFAFKVGHHELRLEGVRFFHMCVRAQNVDGVRQALQDKTAPRPVKVKLLPDEGEYFRAFMPGRLTNDDPDARVSVQPWGLPETSEQDPYVKTLRAKQDKKVLPSLLDSLDRHSDS